MKKLLSLALALLMITGSMVIGVNASAEEPAGLPEVVAYQTTDTRIENDTYVYDVRFIAKVGAWITDYKEVGFTISTTAGGEDYEWDATSTKVYRTLTSKGEDVMTAESQGAAALIAMTITGVPAELGDLAFTVTPYIIDSESAQTDGETGVKTVKRGGYKVPVSGSKAPSQNSSQPVSALFDGDLSLQWYTNSSYQYTDKGAMTTPSANFYGYSFAFDMGGAHSIDMLKIFQNVPITNVKVYASNSKAAYDALSGANWKPDTIPGDWTLIPATNETTNKVMTLTLTNTTAYRYVWVIFDLANPSTDFQVKMYEVEVWNNANTLTQIVATPVISEVKAANQANADQYGVLNLIDGNTSTDWRNSSGYKAGASDFYNHSFAMKLERSVSYNQILINQKGDSSKYLKDFVIYATNDASLYNALPNNSKKAVWDWKKAENVEGWTKLTCTSSRSSNLHTISLEEAASYQYIWVCFDMDTGKTQTKIAEVNVVYE